MGVVTLLSSTPLVAPTLHLLHTVLGSTWAPGAYLRTLVILSTSTSTDLASTPSLSSLYHSSVAYLVGGEAGGPSLLHLHPFTGLVSPVRGPLYPDYLQVVTPSLTPLQDLGGTTLTAVSLEFPPFLTITREEGEEEVEAGDSVDWRILTTLAAALNFTVTAVHWHLGI